LAWLKDFLREIVTAIVTLLANRQPIVRSARRPKPSNDTERTERFLTDDYIKMLKTFADLVPKSAQLIVMDDRFFNAG
jgi:hypothetical protein